MCEIAHTDFVTILTALRGKSLYIFLLYARSTRFQELGGRVWKPSFPRIAPANSVP